MEIFRMFGSVFINDKASADLDNIDTKARKTSDGFRKVSKVALGVSTGILAIGVAAAKGAMDLEGTEAKFNTVFKGMEEAMDDYLDEFRILAPVTKAESRKIASGFQDLLVPMGMARDEAMGLTKETMHLSGALASFNDTNPKDTAEAFTAALTGSYEPLKKYGIQLSKEIVQQKAVEMGLAKTTKGVTKQMEAKAMMALAYDQSGDALAAWSKENLSANEKLALNIRNMKDAGASIMNVLIPAINSVLDKVSQWTQKFMSLDEEQKKQILTIAGIVTAIGPVLFIVGKAIAIYRSLKGVMAAAKAAAIAQNTTLLATIGPIIAVIAIIAGLIAIFVKLYKSNEEFRDLVNLTWAVIKDTIKNGVTFVTNLVNAFVDKLKSLWEGNFMNIQGITKSVFNYIKTIFQEALWTIIAIFDVFNAIFKGDWELLKSSLVSLVSSLWESVKNIFGAYVKVLANIFGPLVDKVLNNFRRIKDGIVKIMKGIGSTVSNIFKKVINGYVKIFNLPITGINKIIKAANKVPGVNIKTVPKLPYLAKGTNYWGGGPAIINEHNIGGEIVDLPRGSRVIPHDVSMEMARNMGKNNSTQVIKEVENISVEIPIYLDGKKIAKEVVVFADEQLDKLRKKKQRGGLGFGHI